MTILAPGTPYIEVFCATHGLVFEDTDEKMADAIWSEHAYKLDCQNVETRHRVSGSSSRGKLESGGVPMKTPARLGFRGKLTAISWEPPKPDITIADWLAEIGLMIFMRDGLQWCLGDCLLYGEIRYGEMFSQVGEAWSAKTLSNWMTVAKAFPVSRRRETLSWSHHATVAALEATEQDVWLDRAEKERWPRSQLRAAVSGAMPEPETCTCPSCGREHRKL